ncbi:unnamed protein product [Rotaria sp. Silwood1]|nr:unnamed protein product [Rotaria sp. Silwood1]CAF1635644.1 unnamed protein product [Rotaria sp. Silwood1]CAF3823942.1 unnamed protein product [Rotaria sp. Silwood1]
MNENFLTLESLSNEILINICKYLNTSDIFQSFYNLNFRFNTLIQSLNNLQLTISEDNQYIDINLLFPYIHSLITIGDVNINLHHFKNIRHLILHHPTNKLLKQLVINDLSYLEYLSIPDILFGMSSIYQKIFSNKFPNLKFCNLFGFETIETILKWTQISSLRILKIGLIDFHVYKAILLACPNLYYLQLKMFQSYLKLSHIQTHSNLKKLEIYSEINDWFYNDQLIDIFLGCVSNLEQLSIYRSISISKIIDLIPDYDWFASIISIRLPLLKYFILCLHIEYHLEFIEFISTETRRQLRKFFLNAHKNRYQSRFIIK